MKDGHEATSPKPLPIPPLKGKAPPVLPIGGGEPLV